MTLTMLGFDDSSQANAKTVPISQLPDALELNPHERRLRGVAVAEVDFGVFAANQPPSPIIGVVSILRGLLAG